MTEIDIAISREFQVDASTEKAFDFLADTRATLAHYPKLEQLVDLGDDCWRWELEPTGLKGISHQVVYSVRYAFDRSAGSIEWTPLDADEDNARIRGNFRITSAENGCKIVLDTDGSLDIPVPKLLAGPAKPIVKNEFEQQISGFISNLKKAM